MHGQAGFAVDRDAVTIKTEFAASDVAGIEMVPAGRNSDLEFEARHSCSICCDTTPIQSHAVLRQMASALAGGSENQIAAGRGPSILQAKTADPAGPSAIAATTWPPPLIDTRLTCAPTVIFVAGCSRAGSRTSTVLASIPKARRQGPSTGSR